MAEFLSVNLGLVVGSVLSDMGHLVTQRRARRKLNYRTHP